jgi:SAM-dependent methyltransferase
VQAEGPRAAIAIVGVPTAVLPIRGVNPTNADQVAYWNGPTGERWTREQIAIDRAFESLTVRLLERAALRSGERVLDVGCGCGSMSLAAADAVGPAGAVLGVDVSVAMLARARERAAGRVGLSFLESDASTHAFEPTFDVAVSRLGVMFFGDPRAAFANLRSALRPGGRLVFVCWRPAADNAWVRVPMEAATRHVPPEPPSAPDAPGPFAFGDAARVERVLTGAGFEGITVSPFDAEVVLSDQGLDAAVRFAMSAGPTSRLLRDVTDEARARVCGELDATLRPFLRGGRVALGGATWLVHALA